EDFHRILHPFEKFGRLDSYIIQEGVKSFTLSGQPISIRVHVQFLNGNWIVGGMNGKIGVASLKDYGITNFHRGAKVTTIDELLSLHMGMEVARKKEVITKLEEVSILVAEVIAHHFPCRE